MRMRIGLGWWDLRARGMVMVIVVIVMVWIAMVWMLRVGPSPVNITLYPHLVVFDV